MIPSENAGHRGLPFERKKTKIIELGVGIGIVSIVLAALQTSELEIKTINLPSAIDLLESNISQNVSPFPPKPEVLDWNDPIADGQDIDIIIIIMADVTYNTCLSDADPTFLYRTRRAQAHGGSQPVDGFPAQTC